MFVKLVILLGDAVKTKNNFKIIVTIKFFYFLFISIKTNILYYIFNHIKTSH
jgi:hypothetical protein